MDSDAHFQQLVRSMPDAKCLHGAQQLQRQGCYLSGVVVAVTDGQAAHHHVGIAYRLHFVDVVVVDDRVEQRVQIVEQVDDLRQSSVGKRVQYRYIQRPTTGYF